MQIKMNETSNEIAENKRTWLFVKASVNKNISISKCLWSVEEYFTASEWDYTI